MQHIDAGKDGLKILFSGHLFPNDQIHPSTSGESARPVSQSGVNIPAENDSTTSQTTELTQKILFISICSFHVAVHYRSY